MYNVQNFRSHLQSSSVERLDIYVSMYLCIHPGSDIEDKPAKTFYSLVFFCFEELQHSIFDAVLLFLS